MMLVPFSSASVAVAALSAPATPQGDRIELLALDVEGVEADAFERALQTRLPERPRIPAGNPDARAGIEHWGYVLVRPVEGGWSLALILADGRGYYRHVAALEGGDSARLIASTLSNLIASVEEDAIAADAHDVVVPDNIVEPAAEPAPAQEQPAEPELVREPPPTKPRPQPLAELGLTLGGVALWPLGPPDPTGFAGAGAELSMSGRLPGGLILGGSFGGLGQAVAGYGLVRLRVAALAGYGLRRGRFELLSLAGASAQPWFVRGPAGSESLRSAEDDRSLSALWGGFVQLSPGVLLEGGQLKAGQLRVRIGPTLRLSGAATTQGGGGIARVLRQTETGPQLLFRLGGLELTTGLDLTLWWTLGTR